MPTSLPAAGGGQRVRRVFHHLQAVAARTCASSAGMSAAQAAVVHRDHGLGAWRDGRLDRGDVDAHRGRVDVDQHHVGAQVAHHLGGGGEGVGGGDHLVARPDAQRLERQVQPRGGGVDGHRVQPVGSPRKASEVVFEALGLRAGGDPAGAQRVHHFGDLFLADVGQRERQERGVGFLGHGHHKGLAIHASTCVRSRWRNGVQQSVERVRVQPRSRPGQGRREGDSRQVLHLRRSGKSWRTRAAARRARSALRGLSTVKSYPEHAAAGAHPAPHRLGQALLEGIVEQRGEHGRGEHDVLRGGLDRHRERVALEQRHRLPAARAAPVRMRSAAVRRRPGAAARSPGAGTRAGCRRCRSRPRAGATPARSV